MPVFSSAPPLKRLTRPDSPRPFRVTARVVSILSAVARFRFLTSDQIARIDGGSHQKVLRLLQQCFYHGLLDRPANQHAQLAAFFDDGNRPMVYGLSRKGAHLLREAGLSADTEKQWRALNRTATAAFLAHTLEVAEAMLHMDFACAAANDLRLLDHRQLVPLMPPATQALDDPFRLRVAGTGDDGRAVSLNVVPDRLFSLVTPDKRWNFALELDRGTMSNGTSATSLAKSSYRRKLIGYFAAWKQRRHSEQWGFKSFRVLTIAPSYARIDHIIAVQRDVTGDTLAELFLYATPADLVAHGPLGPAWRTSERTDVCLTE